MKMASKKETESGGTRAESGELRGKMLMAGVSAIPIAGAISFAIALIDIELYDGSPESREKMDQARVRALAFIISHMIYSFVWLLG